MGDRLATIDMGRELGAVPLLGEGAGSPCKTMRLGLRPNFVPSGMLIHPAVLLQQTGAEICGGCAPWGGAGPASNTMFPGPTPTSIPSGILIHLAVWPQQTWAKNWGLCPLFGETELGLHLAQYGLRRGLLPYQVAS